MKPIALFSVGFRSFFAAGILFSSIAMLVWGLNWWTGLPEGFTPIGGILFWHAHELIMGFGLAIVMGFLLTAVQNWTGLSTAPPGGLVFLLMTWIAARLVMAFGSGLPESIIVAIEILPALGTAVFIGLPIIEKRLWRNLFAPGILVLMAMLDTVLIYQATMGSQAFPSSLLLVAILGITLVLTMIGGRIIPFFTANKLGIKKPEEGKAIFLMSVIPLLVLMLVQAIPDETALNFLSSLCLVVLSIGHFARIKIWHHKGIWKDPMLWSLWLFYACLPVGFVLLSIKPWVAVLGSIPLHIITIGALAGLIISMVSRVSLGHTGRVIQHDKWIMLAFSCLIIALLIRTGGMMITGFSPALISLSALFWSLCFTVLFIRFSLVWVLPRPDGR